MEVSGSLEKLFRVALDLWYREGNLWIVEESAKIVIHVRRYHIDLASLLLGLVSPLYCHVAKTDDIGM